MKNQAYEISELYIQQNVPQVHLQVNPWKKIKLQQYKAKYDKAKEGKWLLAIKWNVHPVKYTINGLKQKRNICELFDHFDSDDNIFHVSVYHRWFNQGSER